MLFKSKLLQLTVIGIIATNVVIWQGVMAKQHEPVNPANQNELTQTVPMKQNLGQLVDQQSEFGVNLFTQIAQDNLEENTFISPLSISLALSMLYNGAGETTQQEMAQTLELTGMSLEDINTNNQILIEQLENADPQVQITIANSLWTKLGFPIRRKFLETTRDFYDANVVQLDFDNPKSAAIINGWVTEKTEGKITEIIDQISPEQALFLINAIYFKGEWTEQFDPAQTQEQPFKLVDGTEKMHPLMSKTGDYPYLENQEVQGVSLPYGEGRLSMDVYLPKPDLPLTDFLNELTVAKIQDWQQEFREQEVAVKLPKFTQEYEIQLNEILQELGMESAFEASQADFSRLSFRSLTVDAVKHKAIVEVNEEGTEAAAVTSIGIVTTSVTMTRLMTIDRPFFFTIRDNETGTILFMGSIFDPSV